MPKRFRIPALIAVLAILVGVYLVQKPADSETDYSFDGASDISFEDIEFDDDARSNVNVSDGLGDLAFTDINGEEVRLKDFRGKKNVVLVMTRGYAGQICMFCSTQTSRLISNYQKFAERDSEVVVVFPIEMDADQMKLDSFINSSKQKLSTPVANVPFPILLDVELKAVDQLGIRKALSKPATYILDKQGKVRFAYVGSTVADRPSIKVMLEQLEALNKGQG